MLVGASGTASLREAEGPATSTGTDTEQKRGARRPNQAIRGTKQSGPQHVLYIQMEFCPRTLRSVLDSGPVDEMEAWQVGPLGDSPTAPPAVPSQSFVT